MSVLIDPRTGSKELLPCFHPYNVGAKIADGDDVGFIMNVLDLDWDGRPELPYGDFCFWGNGPSGSGPGGGDSVLVGWERKTLSDMINSMRDLRYAGHQLDGLMQMYQVVHLVIEGIWRAGPGGDIEIRSGKDWSSFRLGSRGVHYRELDHFLASQIYKRGIVVEYTSNRDQTAALVASRWHWFNDKTWNQHTSDKAIYAPFEDHNGGRIKKAGFRRRVVPDFEKQLAQIHGVGNAAFWVARSYGSAKAFFDHCKSIDQLAAVKVEQQAKGATKVVKLGKAKAEKIWNSLYGIGG